MNRWTLLAFALTGAVLAPPPVAAEVDLAQAEGVTSAEIRISLPDGASPEVAVEPDDRRIRLELPRGSAFPMDFASSSGGLLRGGQVTSDSAGTVLLELELAHGLLDRIQFEPGAVVLRFVSRFRQADSGDDAKAYRLGPEDKISVTVHGHTDLASELTVTSAGTITAPLVGDVEAAGMTPRELAERLAELLGRSYLVDPQVDVEVTSFRSQWVMVTGEVRLPGRIPLRGGTRLKEVLSDAGGFTEHSGEKIVISRANSSGMEHPVENVDRGEFERGEANPVLSPGDIVEIARSQFCYVQGEVRAPSRVRVERGLTLLRAVALVGGLTEWADRTKVQILSREGGESAPAVYNLKKITKGREVDPPLHGGDVIIVKRRFF